MQLMHVFVSKLNKIKRKLHGRTLAQHVQDSESKTEKRRKDDVLNHSCHM